MNVDASSINEFMAFNVKNEARKPNIGQSFNKAQKKERPVCTYCGHAGHAVDKCYKLHAYTLRYKPR